MLIGVTAELGRIIRILERRVISRRMFEDYRLLVAFAIPFGFDTILADLREGFSTFSLQGYMSMYSQDAPLHI